MKVILTFLLVLFGVYQFDDKEVEKRVLSDDLYNYTFYISHKDNIDPSDYKEYHWYKTGSIHSSTGGIGGKVLHGEFKKSYRNNGLAEFGEFRFGLKIKTWKSWYDNGKLEKITNWQAGVRSGGYKEFDEEGTLFWTGKFRHDKKHGKWINHKAKDTLYFKRGEKVTKEELSEEEEGKKRAKKKNKKNSGEKKSFVNKTKDFFKNAFRKKTPEEKAKIKKQKELERKQKALEKKKKQLADKKKKQQAKSKQ